MSTSEVKVRSLVLVQIQANTGNQDMRIMTKVRGAEKSRCQDSGKGQFRPKKDAPRETLVSL